ncbi:MAG: ABC transporter permease [Prosthecobacter sp.]|nr:ABC transporter permease [Prosthecobacter sp.]
MKLHPFMLALVLICAAYLLFWAAMLGATASYTTPAEIWQVLISREIRYATALSLITCTVAALASVVVAVPIGYLISRARFPGRSLVDAALDIPIVLPPMVVGLCLLIFFQTAFGSAIEKVIPLTYTVAGVILAQFVIAAAFAIRTMRSVFDHLPARPEDVARTLGCTHFQAVWHVTLPAARRGMFAAGSVAWARSLGEFGPVLVFAGATRMKTEVLPTSVWLAWTVGELEQGVAVSLLMILLSTAVLVGIRLSGERV